MPSTVLVGGQWGDEGKGKFIDIFAGKADVVVRSQGGNNAGHTVLNEYGKFALHLLPSGSFQRGTGNLLGNGVVVDLERLWEEMEDVRQKGVHIGPDTLLVSDRAPIVFPFHRDQDALEEARLKDAKYGSTKRGIAPVYSDKFQKKTIMMGELMDMDYLGQRLKGILEWKNLTIQNVYGAEPYDYDTLMAWLEKFGGQLRPYICDAGSVLRLAQLRSGADMFERRLLRSHPNLRSKRHGSKLIDLLRQKKDGVVKK